MTPRDLHKLRQSPRLVARGARLRTLTRLVARSDAKMAPMVVAELQRRMRVAMPRKPHGKDYAGIGGGSGA